MSSTEKIENLQAKLQVLSFKYGEDLKNHVSKFVSIADEFAAQDQT